MKRLFLFFLLMLLTSPVCAATLAQYDHALAQLQADLQTQAGSLSSSPSRPLKSSLMKSSLTADEKALGRITAVDTPDGGLQRVQNAPLLQEAAQAVQANAPLQAEAVVQQIQMLRRELAPLPVSEQGSKLSVALAHSILGQPAYASLPFPPPSLAQRIAAWVDRQLARIHLPKAHFRDVPDINVSPVFIEVLLYLMLAGAVTILIAVLVPILARHQKRSRNPLPLDAAEEALVEARDKDSLLAMAQSLAQNGEYRRAFRLVYLAALIALDTGGILHFDRSRTNWESLRALRAAGRSDISQALTPFTREFDQVWYGNAETTMDDYQRAAAQYHALQAAMPSAAVNGEGLAALPISSR